MARSRNIKPGIITNDDLAATDPFARLVFIYSWMLADFNGNLEYKPAKLKVQTLPYDDVSIEDLVSELEQAGFVKRYYENGSRYMHICNFKKHQNPHKNEVIRGSEIPTPDESNTAAPPEEKSIKKQSCKSDSGKIETITEQVPSQNGTDPADSLSLIPDSGSRIPDTDTTACASEDAQSEQRQPAPPSKKKSAEVDYSGWPELPDEQILKDWLKARTKARAVHSQTAINSIGKELHKAVAMGYTVNQCGEEAATRGWRGFKAEWMQGSVSPANGSGVVPGGNVTKFRGRQSVDEKNQEVALRWAAGGDFYDQE